MTNVTDTDIPPKYKQVFASGNITEQAEETYGAIAIAIMDMLWLAWIVVSMTLSWQNVVVERDLAVTKRISGVAQGSVHVERQDSRCRIVVDGECEGKLRGERLTGTTKAVAMEWCKRQRRQQSPSASVLRGSQGPMPQRGARGRPGALEQIVVVEPAHLWSDGGGVEEVDITTLLMSV